jgi:hypothetical protein
VKAFRFFWVPIAICMIFLLSASAQATEFPYPKVGYSADVQMDMGKDPDGKPLILTGKVYFSNDKERREVVAFGEKTVIIWRRDKGVTWQLIPNERMYMESRGGPETHNPERMMREGDVKLTKLGSERINGMTTIKYRIEAVQKDGSRFDGHQWVTKENVPVRIEGTSKSQHFRIDYTNIQIGKQDPGLFEIPDGYERMPEMPGWPPMGMGPGREMPQGPSPGGMTTEQMEQMQKQMEEMMKRMRRQ